MLINQIDIYREKKNLPPIPKTKATKIHRSTLQKVRLQLATKFGILPKKADRGTVARQIAVASKLNALNFAAAMNGLVPQLKYRNCLLNVDDTHFEASGGDDNVEVWAVTKDHDATYKVEVDPEKPNAGDLAFTVKERVIAAAGGVQGEAYYYLADDRMNAEDFEVYEVLFKKIIL